MKEALNYRYASLQEVEMLVELRLQDLRLFSERELPPKAREAIHHFYQEKMAAGQCHTLLGESCGRIAATATVYYYETLPSNENPLGKTAQLTSIWVDEAFRRQGIARHMAELLLEQAKRDGAGRAVLNSSEMAEGLYLKIGFQRQEHHFTKTLSSAIL